MEGWIIKQKLQTLVLEQRKEVYTKAHKKGFKMLTHLEAMKALSMVKNDNDKFLKYVWRCKIDKSFSNEKLSHF